jgi:hypothetical protein
LKKTVAILSIALGLLTIESCKKDPGAAPDLGYNYFPDQVGHYVIYKVDSIFYDSFYYPAKVDTFEFQLKEKIESVYTDNEGRPTMRLERYVKKHNDTIPYSSMSWQLRNVWAQNKTLKRVEKVEENMRFVKLVFPVEKDLSWNGNAFNSLGDQNYKYNFVDIARTIGGIRFDSVLQVDQRNQISLISNYYYEEKYARNTGLIYKRVIDVESQPNPAWADETQYPFGSDSLEHFFEDPIMERITSGFQYTMTVISYGTE